LATRCRFHQLGGFDDVGRAGGRRPPLEPPEPPEPPPRDGVGVDQSVLTYQQCPGQFMWHR
jgi:hypothetical protein